MKDNDNFRAQEIQSSYLFPSPRHLSFPIHILQESRDRRLIKIIYLQAIYFYDDTGRKIEG